MNNTERQDVSSGAPAKSGGRWNRCSRSQPAQAFVNDSSIDLVERNVSQVILATAISRITDFIHPIAETFAV